MADKYGTDETREFTLHDCFKDGFVDNETIPTSPYIRVRLSDQDPIAKDGLLGSLFACVYMFSRNDMLFNKTQKRQHAVKWQPRILGQKVLDPELARPNTELIEFKFPDLKLLEPTATDAYLSWVSVRLSLDQNDHGIGIWTNSFTKFDLLDGAGERYTASGQSEGVQDAA